MCVVLEIGPRLSLVPRSTAPWPGESCGPKGSGTVAVTAESTSCPVCRACVMETSARRSVVPWLR